MTDTATLEKRVEILRALAAVGKNYDEISNVMDLPYQNVYAMARTHGITVARKTKTNALVPQVQSLVEEGLNAPAIAVKLKISDASVRNIIKKHGIDAAIQKKAEAALSDVRALAEAGEGISEIATKLNLVESSVRALVKQHGIKIIKPVKTPTEKLSQGRLERLAEVERLFVKERMSSAEIARHFNISREMIRQDLALMDIIPRKINAEQRKKNAEVIKGLAAEGLITSEIAERMQISDNMVRSIARDFEIEISRLKAVPHGTTLSYMRGCTCQLCRDANAEAARQAKKRRIEKGVPDHLHGTASAYTNWDCRCEPCMAAGSAANKASTFSPGPKDRNHAVWTEEEDTIVMDYGYTARELAELINRTVGAVNTRRAKLAAESA